MKKFILLSILFIGLHHDLFSQEQSGIRFFSGTWKDVIAEAKKKKLPIFVDVYTDWCAPCKRMEREVFILPKVGKFFNSNFLCYRLNAEKAEGPELSKIFGFNAFPTWLYLNSEGILMSRNTDYMNADRFINSALITSPSIKKSQKKSCFLSSVTRGKLGRTPARLCLKN